MQSYCKKLQQWAGRVSGGVLSICVPWAVQGRLGGVIKFSALYLPSFTTEFVIVQWNAGNLGNLLECTS